MTFWRDFQGNVLAYNTNKAFNCNPSLGSALEGYNNILSLVATRRTGRHLIENLFRMYIFLHIFCQTLRACPVE